MLLLLRSFLLFSSFALDSEESESDDDDDVAESSLDAEDADSSELSSEDDVEGRLRLRAFLLASAARFISLQFSTKI